MSRNIMGSLQNLQNKQVVSSYDFFPWIALLSWALVMFLFEDDRSALQPSLTSSMNFLYRGRFNL